MDLLILGGTGFLGRHLVEAALGEDHRVTLFNRGLSGPDLFPEVETIKGDRDGDLSGLHGRRWDAAIDTCGYVPRVVRASAGGEVLAPDRPERRVQFIDVRDLAAWIVKMSVEKQTGTYNAAGPGFELRMGKLLGECEAVGGGNAKIVWVSEEFLEQNGVDPFTELALWVPREYAGMLAVDCGRAIAAGLTFRPTSETILDVLQWDSKRANTDLAAGFKPERERELLLAWHGANL